MLAKLIVVSMAAASIHAEDSLFGSGLRPGAYRGAGYPDSAYPSVPFSFGYDTVDEFGTRLFHKEDADASNSRTGSYGYTDPYGLFRRVNYVADAGGFRATVETNEPGTAPGQSADAVFNANPVVSGPGVRAPGAFGASAYGTAAGATYGYAGKQDTDRLDTGLQDTARQDMVQPGTVRLDTDRLDMAPLDTVLLGTVGLDMARLDTVRLDMVDQDTSSFGHPTVSFSRDDSFLLSMLAKLIVVCMAASIHAEDSLFGSGLNPGVYRGAGYADYAYPSVPFSFGYDTVDEFGTKLFHKEDADASNSRTGSYGYTDPNGLFRRVNYVADAGGFRATVETNEPGTAPGQSADAVFNANPVVSGPGVRAPGAFGASAYGTAAGPAYGYGGKYGYTKDPYVRLGYGQAGYGRAEYGQAGYESAAYGAAGYGPARYGPAGYGTTGYGAAGYDAAGYGTTGYGVAGHSTAGYGRTGYGLPVDGHRGYGHHGYKARS
ncbi:hypothetical protein ISCGN_011781 [Ixodes scapularis]